MNNSINYCGFVDMLDRSANRPAARGKRLDPQITPWDTAWPKRQGTHLVDWNKAGQTRHGEYKSLS